ncbi:MAG: hypothetical protein ABJA82_01800 [Myxococcales bacterium]
MLSQVLSGRTVQNVGGLVACLTMAMTLDACSSSPAVVVSDASTGAGGSGCSLSGAFHVTFAPSPGSQPACLCNQCSYDVVASHINDTIDFASANVEYFLEPLLAGDAGAARYGSGSCDSTETSSCIYNGSCMSTDGIFSTAFTFTLRNGRASGTQSFVTTGGVNCTYEVTASPALGT